MPPPHPPNPSSPPLVAQIVAHKVDIGPAKIITATKASFTAVNPKGNVPALVLADGTLLNEGAATLQFIADLAPGSGLAAPAGSSARYLQINSLNYLASELHASYGPLFGPGSDEFKAAQKTKIATKYAYIEAQLEAGKIGAAATPDIADLYLYIIQSWSGYVGVDLSAYPKLNAFAAKVAALPAVAKAHADMNAAA